ncbi:MAG: NADPH:quinone reductase [Betaproteobacteria bacterium]
MRAISYSRKGPAREVLEIGEMPTPKPGPGEVLVRVSASGVNPSDTKSRSGWAGVARMPFPRIIPHQDGAGVVEAVGEGVPPHRVGERVWIYEGQWQRPFGTCAEYIALPAGRAVRLPDAASFTDGACLGIPVMTAHRCVFADGPVKDRTVLVTGGAGAVGHYAVQLAKWGGATVITTVSSDEKAEVARMARPDHIVNYRTEDAAARIVALTGGAGVDRIVEVAFGANLPVAEKVIKTNGTIATYASDAVMQPVVPFRPFLARDVTVRFVLVYVMPHEAKEAAIGAITHLLDTGYLRHHVYREYPMTEVADAHDAIEHGESLGNVVVRIDS